MSKAINILRYKELMELGKIRNNSFSDEEFWELIDFEATVERQISYNRKKEYVLLMDKYFNQQIDSYEFRKLFLIMKNEDARNTYIICNDLQALESFKLANDPSNISNLITKISMLCLDFNAIAYETKDEMAESEIQFDSSVKKHYCKLQELFSKENLYYEKLIFRSFNMLKCIIGSEILIIFLYSIIGR
jgi:hypothetical protein